ERAFARARELAMRLGDNNSLISVLIGLRLHYRFTQNLREARKIAEEIFSVASSGDIGQTAIAYYQLGDTSLFQGNFATALRELTQAGPDLRRWRLFLATDVQGGVLPQTVWATWILGFPAQALHGSREAIAAARRAAQPMPLLFALAFVARLNVWLCDAN